MTDRPQTQDAANRMWGGRSAAGPDAIMEAINASIGFDKRLYAQDIRGSRAHAAMLAAQGIISDSDASAIGEGLLTVLSEIEAGDFPFQAALEDIHMNVESRLKEIIGEAAGRLVIVAVIIAMVALLLSEVLARRVARRVAGG